MERSLLIRQAGAGSEAGQDAATGTEPAPSLPGFGPTREGRRAEGAPGCVRVHTVSLTAPACTGAEAAGSASAEV